MLLNTSRDLMSMLDAAKLLILLLLCFVQQRGMEEYMDELRSILDMSSSAVFPP